MNLKNEDLYIKNSITISQDIRPNLPRIAKFEKVPYEQFKEDFIKTQSMRDDTVIKGIYDNIKLPKRATFGSCGFDFFAPFDFCLDVDTDIVIPTGIRCNINPGWWLGLYPRSGSGFKYKVQLFNTVGIIDGDYYYADNYGHIMVKLTSKKPCMFEKGSGYCQGIFTIFGITEDDDAKDIRTGGLGSTGN